MMNTLQDLNNYLFEQIERINDDELSDEQLQKEITRSQAITKISEVIVRNAELSLKTMQHLNEFGYGKGNDDPSLAPVPAMLEGKKS